MTDLDKKKKELNKKKEEIAKNQKTIPKDPFSERQPSKFSKKQNRSVHEENKQPDTLDLLLDCNYRVSYRKHFGVKPDKVKKYFQLF